MKLRVNEIFYSIDGEGKRAGELASFIRLTGCNLRCSYCDTQYSFAEGEEMTPEEIVDALPACKNVTLTGGEPLMQDVHELLTLLRGKSVNIETNGSVDIRPYMGFPQAFFTLDYKCGSSGMKNKMMMDNFSLLRPQDVLKFVVGNMNDLDEAKNLCEDIKPICPVYISPVFGMINPSKIVQYMKDNFLFKWRVQLQIHKFIWRPEERGV